MSRPLTHFEVQSAYREEKKRDVMRLVEAQIAGCVDLSPQEMVDAAFLMVEKINRRIMEDAI